MCPQSEKHESRLYALGKHISVFAERLAVSPPERVHTTISEGLKAIIELVDADRICWYEVDAESETLLHKYTGCVREAPLSPKNIPAGKMPYMAQHLGQHEVVVLRELNDLPPAGCADRQFLEGLGVKSLLLIPSSYSQLRKGVLGVSSYSVEVIFPEETINQLAIAANIIGATLERMYAQTATQESEHRFQCLFAQASVGIALETMDGRILEVNPAFCSMIGYSAEELLNTTCSNLTHPDDEKIEKVLFEELRVGLRPSYSMEKRFFRKDGNVMWGHINVSLLNTNHGSPPLVIGTVSDITAQKMAEASLSQRDRELQLLAGRLIEAQEEERCRISRELHDDIGQRVALLTSEVGVVSQVSLSAQKENAPVLFPKLHKELSAIATDIHELSHELHSARLQYCGLKVALKDLCLKYLNHHQLEVDLYTENLDPNLSPDVALCLYRVAQEALANVLKHGQTSQVFLRVIVDSDKVRLTIKDLGAGFDTSVHSGGIGLVSMRERVHFSGGLFSVKSAPNQGTEIAVEIAVAKKLAATSNG